MQRPVGKGEESACVSCKTLVSSEMHLTLYVTAAHFCTPDLGRCSGKDQKSQTTLTSSEMTTVLSGPEGIACGQDTRRGSTQPAET